MTHDHDAAAAHAESSGTDAAFVTERTFDAPRDVVYQAWADPDQLAKWFGPVGMPAVTHRFDLRPGGSYLYSMAVPNAGTWWGLWAYREVVPGDRLVYVASFADADGHVTRAPFAADWPLETLSTVTFADAGGGRTTVTLTGVPINATEAERQKFKANHASMTQGWGGTFGQLAAYLAAP